MYIHNLVPISANKLSQTPIYSSSNEVIKIIRSMIFFDV